MNKTTFIAERSGQSLVELALVLPVLLTLLLGMAEYGRLCYIGIEVTNAAHADAQYAAQNHATASNALGIQNAATNDAADLTAMSVTPAPKELCAASYSSIPTTNCSGTPALYMFR
jgi:Flp pilus assembly protein TadG